MENLKAFANEVWLFLTSGIFLKNFAGIIAVVVGFVLFSNWFLGCFTNHGESVQVDDFLGMTLEDAQRQAREKDFEFEVIGEKYETDKPANIILTQVPKPLSRVKEGRKIFVTITGKPEPIRLPEFKNSSYEYERYAQKLKAHYGINCRIKERIFDRREADETIKFFYHNGKKITEREVKSGYYVMPGDVLEFVVTEQLSNELQVPDLVCMNYSAAEFLVSSSNLIIGTVNDEGTISNQSTAYVSRQEPTAGEPIQMGGQLTVWISQAPPDGCADANDDSPSEGDEDENW